MDFWLEMKTFIISVPKSGTYLLREILEQAGAAPSQLHISESGTYDYSKISYELGRRQPNKCKTRMPLEESLALIPENSFAVGHLAYSPETADMLKDFNVLFVGRDIKEIYLSFMIYQIETGRALRDPIDDSWARADNPVWGFHKFLSTRGDKLMTKYITQILPWRNEENVNCFDFNELKDDKFTQTSRIVKTIGRYTDQQVWNIVDSSFDKKTQTLSQQTDRSQYWSGVSHQIIDDLMKKYKVNYP